MHTTTLPRKPEAMLNPFNATTRPEWKGGIEAGLFIENFGPMIWR